MMNAFRKSPPDELDVLAYRILILLSRSTKYLRVSNNLVGSRRLCPAVKRLRNRVFLFTVAYFECAHFSGKRTKINRWCLRSDFSGKTAIKSAKSVWIRSLDCLAVFEWALELSRLQVCVTNWDDRLGAS